MGARKRLAAEKRKEDKKQQYFAVLRNCPTSPRKMRLVADSIRGMEVNKALDVLKYSSKEASRRVEKYVRLPRVVLTASGNVRTMLPFTSTEKKVL